MDAGISTNRVFPQYWTDASGTRHVIKLMNSVYLINVFHYLIRRGHVPEDIFHKLSLVQEPEVRLIVSRMCPSALASAVLAELERRGLTVGEILHDT